MNNQEVSYCLPVLQNVFTVPATAEVVDFFSFSSRSRDRDGDFPAADVHVGWLRHGPGMRGIFAWVHDPGRKPCTLARRQGASKCESSKYAAARTRVSVFI